MIVHPDIPAKAGQTVKVRFTVGGFQHREYVMIPYGSDPEKAVLEALWTIDERTVTIEHIEVQ